MHKSMRTSVRVSMPVCMHMSAHTSMHRYVHLLEHQMSQHLFAPHLPTFSFSLFGPQVGLARPLHGNECRDWHRGADRGHHRRRRRAATQTPKLRARHTIVHGRVCRHVCGHVYARACGRVPHPPAMCIVCRSVVEFLLRVPARATCAFESTVVCGLRTEAPAWLYEPQAACTHAHARSGCRFAAENARAGAEAEDG